MFKKVEEVLGFEFPENVSKILDELWKRIPDEKQKMINKLYDNFVPHAGEFKKLVELINKNTKGLINQKSKIAIIGPANVGKSSIFNLFLPKTNEKANVGPIPGVTRVNQESDMKLFTLIDTPGADAVGEVGEKEKEIAFKALDDAEFVLIVFEATRGIKNSELKFFNDVQLIIEDKPFIVICNKMDLINKKNEKNLVLEKMAHNLSLEKKNIISMSAKTGQNFDKLILAIAKLDPAFLEMLGKVLPKYQNQLAWQRIIICTTSCGAISLAPIPFADIIPLLALQSGLVASIARIYGINFDLMLTKEAAALFGSGLLARTLFKGLVKFTGAPGWIISVAISVSATIAIGLASQQWFVYGEKPTREWVESKVKEIFVIAYQSIRQLWKEKPTKENFKDKLYEVFDSIVRKISPETVIDIDELNELDDEIAEGFYE